MVARIEGVNYTVLTVASAKRKASLILNKITDKTHQTFLLETPNGNYHFNRINRRTPDGRITFGIWK